MSNISHKIAFFLTCVFSANVVFCNAGVCSFDELEIPDPPFEHYGDFDFDRSLPENFQRFISPFPESDFSRDIKSGNIDCKALTPKQVDILKKEMDKYLSSAKYCYDKAKDRCWWLPNMEHRKASRYLFETIMYAAIPVADAKSRLIFILVKTFVDYGLECMDEWHYIHDKLKWAQWYYQEYEWRQKIWVEN